MMVTSDNTPLSAIRTDAKTGRPTRTNPAAAVEVWLSRPPIMRPTTTNIRTGNRIDPAAPIGSRRKILISSQVSLKSPRNICVSLIANRMAGQFQKNVLQIRQHSTKIGDADAVLGETLDHLGHEVVAAALNGETGLLAGHGLCRLNPFEAFFGERVIGVQHNCSGGTVPAHQFRGTSNIDDLSVLNDGDAVA